MFDGLTNCSACYIFIWLFIWRCYQHLSPHVPCILEWLLSWEFFLLMHCAIWSFTKYNTTNKCTSRTIYQFKITYTKTLSLLLHVSIAHSISSSGSTYSFWPKSCVKIVNIPLLLVLWQHIIYLCVCCFWCGDVCGLTMWLWPGTIRAPWWWYALCYRNV